MAKQGDMANLGLFKNMRLLIVTVVLPATVFLLLMQIIFKLNGIPFYTLVADPNEIGKLPPYAGMISMLGILFWCASAAISIFTASFLSKNKLVRSKKWSNFLLLSGFLTLFILLDDLFQIHEYYFHPFVDLKTWENPRRVQNFFETVFFIIYMILIGMYLYRFKSIFKITNYNILLLALSFFAISTIVDIATPESMFLHYTIEEGLKFLGIVTWFSYFMDCSYQQLKSSIGIEQERMHIGNIQETNYSIRNDG
ncbi:MULTISPECIES: hypothetical protein [Nostocaceae]|nr:MULTISPECIES: hypothetical protein [Nostocaceae]MBC1268346.1 hypothetical protein [Trichormus variabilis FSR]MBC1305299.1 hypothetical protein [Trichormus variabilis N2B]MBC1314362.1 hypothetical protein [Trichormus variabilis PNB]MBC1326454.1 hypothetical protein [Trichormus variabilis 9RC]MBD2382821.1 hypothetical protein [Trichormus variabilis FACHB-319]